MNEELEILDNGNQHKTGSRTFQLVLFIFACIGFAVKLIYSIYTYGMLSRLNFQGSDADFGKMINIFKLMAIGIFLHSLLLFSGALLLFLRRKAGIWLYFASHLIFFVAMFYTWMYSTRIGRMSNLELLIFSVFFIIPTVFIVMNLVNRRYWLNRKQP